jgi:DNA-directed RNA polymerase subunit RPC12/RpoP
MKQEIIYDVAYKCQVCGKDYLAPTDEMTETHRELACFTCGTIEVVPRTFLG